MTGRRKRCSSGCCERLDSRRAGPKTGRGPYHVGRSRGFRGREHE
jgi:hypothetical protein